MKQLSQDAIEALEIIKPCAISGDTRLSQEQFLAMKCVYENIDLVYNNRKTIVNPGCTGCIPMCLKIIGNYLKMMGGFHEKPKQVKPAKVERVEVMKAVISDNGNSLVVNIGEGKDEIIVEKKEIGKIQIDPIEIKPKKKKSNAKRKRK